MKKYKNKLTGEVVEAEQWFKVSYVNIKESIAGPFGSYVHKLVPNLGVEHLVSGQLNSFLEDGSGEKKCVHCGAFYQYHGSLPGGSNTCLVCPGEYVVKTFCGDVFLSDSTIFNCRYEKIVEGFGCWGDSFLASKRDRVGIVGPIRYKLGDEVDEVEKDQPKETPEPSLEIGDELIFAAPPRITAKNLIDYVRQSLEKEFNKPVPKPKSVKNKLIVLHVGGTRLYEKLAADLKTVDNSDRRLLLAFNDGSGFIVLFDTNKAKRKFQKRLTRFKCDNETIFRVPNCLVWSTGDKKEPAPKPRQLKIFYEGVSPAVSEVLDIYEDAIVNLELETQRESRTAFIDIQVRDTSTCRIAGARKGIEWLWHKLTRWQGDKFLRCEFHISDCVLVEYAPYFKRFVLKD